MRLPLRAVAFWFAGSAHVADGRIAERYLLLIHGDLSIGKSHSNLSGRINYILVVVNDFLIVIIRSMQYF